MPNANLTRLMDHTQIRLPGALDSVIRLELFALMNDFFQGSNIWFEDIPFDVVPYDGPIIANPEAFTYDLVPIMGSITRLSGVRDSQGSTRSASMPVLGQVLLNEAPQDADTYTARVFLTVTDPVSRDGTPQFPDWILNKYGGDILNGLMGRMMSQLAKPYSNLQLANVHLRQFRAATMQAKVEASRQNLYRAQNWRYPQAFRVRRFRHI